MLCCTSPSPWLHALPAVALLGQRAEALHVCRPRSRKWPRRTAVSASSSVDVVKGRGHQRLGALFSGPVTMHYRKHIHRGGELVIIRKGCERRSRSTRRSPGSSFGCSCRTRRRAFRPQTSRAGVPSARLSPHLDHDVQLLVQVRPRGVVCRVLIRHHPPVQASCKATPQLEALPFAALQFVDLTKFVG